MDSPNLANEAPERIAAELVFAPLGVPLYIALDDRKLIAAVRSACRPWEGGTTEEAVPLRLRLGLARGLRGLGGVRFRVTANELHIAGPGVEGRALADARRGWCAISSDYLAEPQRLREDVIEPLALWLITRSGRTPIHAAGFLAGDLAVLLAGRSGSGKSCLAVAADHAGLEVLSDDTVYLQRAPAQRVWGWRGPAHLLPADARGARGAIRIRNGRAKYAVPLYSCARGGAKPDKAVIAILQHGDRAALGRIEPDEAMRRLAELEPGFDLLRADIEAAHRLLTANGAWLLTLSQDPADAITLLKENLARLRATAVS